MLKKLVPVLILSLFAFGSFSWPCSAANTRQAVESAPFATVNYTPHAPIIIANDTDFTAQFSNRTIWGFIIDGTGLNCCIYIGNCSLPFTVKDCYLYNATHLVNSSNGTISNNHCSGNRLNGFGIYIEHSNSITFIGNNCSANFGFGIALTCSDKNTFVRNTCCGNYEFGIGVSYSNNSIFLDNNCSQNKGAAGIDIFGSNDNTLANNTCDNNSEEGILLHTSVKNTTLLLNICNGNVNGIYPNFDR